MQILVTRPKAQSQSLIAAITSNGDKAVALPLLKILPITVDDERASAIKSQVLKLGEYEHVIFISTNAAELAIDWIGQYWLQLPRQHWYGIGNATTKALQIYNPDAINNGRAMNSEALLALNDLQKITGQKILIMRGVGGRDFLCKNLRARGAEVSYCELYERKAACYRLGTLSQLLVSGVEMLTLGSIETVQSLCDQAMLEGIYGDIQELAVVVPGVRVANYAAQQGFKNVVIAVNAGLEATLDAINNEKSHKIKKQYGI